MEPKHKLDRWLDQALTDYGNAEPRTGLETRILANLAAEKARASRRILWLWTLASVAVTLIVVVAFWPWLSTQKPHTPTKLANNNTVLQKKEAPVSAESTVQVSAPQAVKRRKPRQLAKVPEPEKAPRLSQFPSVRELSTQEQLLVRYAQEFPKQALEVAQAQAAAKQERINAELAAE
ncbi:MAG TPA: hypothetical protein VIW67_20865 [Terriglobales bacterium]|jgi:hypothetical protein